MKVIPKKDLIEILEKEVEKTLLTRYTFDDLFETYGDDWFISDTDHTKYVQYTVNKKRENLLGQCPVLSVQSPDLSGQNNYGEE